MVQVLDSTSAVVIAEVVHVNVNEFHVVLVTSMSGVVKYA